MLNGADFVVESPAIIAFIRNVCFFVVRDSLRNDACNKPNISCYSTFSLELWTGSGLASVKSVVRESQLKYYSEGEELKTAPAELKCDPFGERETDSRQSQNKENPRITLEIRRVRSVAAERRTHYHPSYFNGGFFHRRRFRAANERRKLRYAFHRNTANAAGTRLESPRGRISSSELARNSSRLYLPGTGETATSETNTRQIVAGCECELLTVSYFSLMRHWRKKVVKKKRLLPARERNQQRDWKCKNVGKCRPISGKIFPPRQL